MDENEGQIVFSFDKGAMEKVGDIRDMYGLDTYTEAVRLSILVLHMLALEQKHNNAKIFLRYGRRQRKVVICDREEAKST